MSEVGRLLAGRYRLRRRIGSGAMGVVWKALDERLRRDVAVKQLIPQPGLSAEHAEEARQRAIREGRIAARLRHPHAVAVYDVDEHDGLPLLVMEYFPSRSLSEVIAERRLTPIEAAGIGAQAASALAEAHAAGVVHRDVKPGNILIGDDGTVKISDFGISRATGDVTVTQSGMVAGTPAYFAPETARGRAATPSADVFSLGSTLYAAVEGVLPFDDDEDNPLAVLHRVAAGVVPPPRHAGPLAPILDAMLATDPAARPSSADVARALQDVAEGRQVTLAPHAALVAVGGADAPTDPLAGTAAPTMTVHPAPGTGGTRLDVRPLADLDHEQPAAARPSPPRSRWWLLAAGVLVLGLLTGILAATLSGDDDSADTAPPPTSASARPLSPASMQQAVAEFYAALPADTDRAWATSRPPCASRAGTSSTATGPASRVSR